MRGWSALLLLGGCAQIFGIDATKAAADASRDTAPPLPDAPDCAGGDLATFDPVIGHCYTYFMTPMARDAAKTACEMNGAHLARIASMYENNVVVGLVGATGVAYLGANDLSAEGTFVWDDGTVLEYMNWNTGSPDSGGGAVDEDCVVIDGAAGGAWDDRPCSGAFAFVCERE